jgi:hypothetical protein
MREICVVIGGIIIVQSFKYYINVKMHYENTKGSNYEEFTVLQRCACAEYHAQWLQELPTSRISAFITVAF